jgi:hypothetical protein
MMDYGALPDGMTSAEVAAVFEQLLAEATGCDPPPEERIAEALCEIADRQWHTYGLLRSDLLLSVERWVQEHWRTDTDEYVGNLVCVVTRLGLQPLMQYVHDALHEDVPTDVRERLQSLWDETRGDVTDPFNRLLEIARRTVPVDPALRNCWTFIVQGIEVGWLTQLGIDKLVAFLRDGRDWTTDELSFEHLDDAVRVSFLDDHAECSPVELAKKLEALLAATRFDRRI